MLVYVNPETELSNTITTRSREQTTRACICNDRVSCAFPVVAQKRNDFVHFVGRNKKTVNNNIAIRVYIGIFFFLKSESPGAGRAKTITFIIYITRVCTARNNYPNTVCTLLFIVSCGAERSVRGTDAPPYETTKIITKFEEKKKRIHFQHIVCICTRTRETRDGRQTQLFARVGISNNKLKQ